MKDKDVKKIVRKAYSQIATDSSSCCSCGCGSVNPKMAQKISKSIGYSEEEMNAVPEANLGLGCGNPTAFSSIKEGDVVLDLGSGAGFDCFLASKKVGKTGKVIGVDMTEEMIDKARILSKMHGYSNVEFRLGDIEKLPIEDGSVDAVISNCVINLAPNKLKVFKEAYRVLKGGGKMYVSDIVLLGELSEEQKNDDSLLCECVSGALLKKDYLDKMGEAGFSVKIVSEDKDVSKTQYHGIPLESLKVEATKGISLAKTKVIFLCTHNSARSQMAEAFLRRYAGDYFDAYSAGFKPQPLHPYTIKVMQEIGYDLSKAQPKELWQLIKNEYFGIAITVCKKAEDECPTIPGTSTRYYWDIEDPAAFEGSEEEKLAKFREIRDQIQEQVKKFLRDRKISSE